MNIIKITTDDEISVHPYPKGSIAEQNAKLRELIGNDCDMFEHVRPVRLYTIPEDIEDAKQCESTSILVDEDGHFKKLDVNMAGCYLYESDKHGFPILGNILVIGEKLEDMGISFCGLTAEQFELLYEKLKELTEKSKEVRLHNENITYS